VTRKTAVVINRRAGSVSEKDLRRRIETGLQQHNQRVRVLRVRSSKLRSAARALLNEGFNIIVAGGGDGTVSTVASQLVGRTAALGVLPLGTLNHFARDLGIPTQLDDAITLICSNDPRPVDVGSVNGYTFINNSSLGFYPSQLRIREAWEGTIGKWPAAIMASAIVLARFPNLHVTVEVNGNHIRRRCPMVVISNNEYGFEPGNLTARERLDGGTLGVYLLRDEGRMGLLRVALHALIFKLEEASSFDAYRATEAVITTRRKRVRAALDGEAYKLAAPLRYRLLPGSLLVIAPPTSR
jgi:diacylglycerol kinase family enzyme